MTRVGTDKLTVLSTCSIREAIKQMDSTGLGFMAVIAQDKKMIGIFTDGDFRKAILRNVSLDDNILTITNTNFKSVGVNYDRQEVTDIFTQTVVQHLPVVEDNQLVDLLIKSKWFIESGYTKESKQINIPVVVMAGGKGTRLEPFTSVLPKPLLPVGESPIIEIIMAEYLKYGLNKFYLSVNYKAKMIKAYFEDTNKPYSIEYIDENKPLGTAGSIKLIEHNISTPFFVSNCDVLIRDHYDKIYDFHMQGGYELTLVASMQNHTLPYGVCEIETGGRLKRIKEKPNFDFLANSGMYVLNPSVFQYIPSNAFYDMTDLINDLLLNGHAVGVYPVSESAYMDFGQWSEFKKSLKTLGTLE